MQMKMSIFRYVGASRLKDIYRSTKIYKKKLSCLPLPADNTYLHGGCEQTGGHTEVIYVLFPEEKRGGHTHTQASYSIILLDNIGSWRAPISA